MSVVTREQYNARLAKDPDEYVWSLSVGLDWIDDSTISVTAFGGQERLADRKRNISVGVSGCVAVYYDIVKNNGVWSCGDRSQRKLSSAFCGGLFKKYMATLRSLPACVSSGDCTPYDCHWSESEQDRKKASRIEAELGGSGCGDIVFSCAAAGATATTRLVLQNTPNPGGWETPIGERANNWLQLTGPR